MLWTKLGNNQFSEVCPGEDMLLLWDVFDSVSAVLRKTQI